MQFSVPEALDVSGESKSEMDLYGDSEYATGCLPARRLIERGVRSVQLSLCIDGYDNTCGATDNLGCSAVENRTHVHDLHAAILHLMGLNHEKLTCHSSGSDYRLTDVPGSVVQDVLT